MNSVKQLFLLLTGQIEQISEDMTSSEINKSQ